MVGGIQMTCVERYRVIPQNMSIEPRYASVSMVALLTDVSLAVGALRDLRSESFQSISVDRVDVRR